MRRSRGARASRSLALMTVLVLVPAGCGGSNADGGTTTSAVADTDASVEEGGTTQATAETLTIANFTAFSGEFADWGTEAQAGCVPAANLVNANGGALGHTFDCLPVDTRADATEAVTAAQQLLATEDNVVGVLGPSFAEASTMAIWDEAAIPYWPSTGDPRYNEQESDYFWRLNVSDDLIGAAFATWIERAGYERPALFVANDPSSQAAIENTKNGLEVFGIEPVAEVEVEEGQLSYRAEASEVASASPDVLVIQALDPGTIAAFLGDFVSRYEAIPIINHIPPQQPRLKTAVTGALGSSQAYDDLYISIHQYAPTEGEAWDVFNEALRASTEIDNPDQWAEDIYTMVNYDAVTLTALAIIAADSVDPTVFNEHIAVLTQPGEGKTVVFNFASGKEAIESGEAVQFTGTLGVVAFNEWHNSGGQFITVKPSGDTEEELGVITGDEISALTSQY